MFLFYRMFGSLSAMLLALAATASAAATVNFPGVTAGCDTTLQSCIDSATAGDTILITTNTPIVDTVTIDKSIIIRRAPGFAPTLAGAFVTTNDANVAVEFRELTVTRSIRGRITSIHNLSLTVIDNVITASSFQSAIELDNASAVDAATVASLIVTNNRINQLGSTGSCGDAIRVSGSGGITTAAIVANEITATNLAQCAAIQIVGGAGAIEASIQGNRIAGSNFNAGISLFSFAAGQALNARILNNLIVGQNGNVGAPGGIVANASGTNARIDASIVNNTIASGRSGALISARTDLGASVTGVLANNIVANHSVHGIVIDSDLTVFANRNNLVFGNPNNSFIAGTGTRTGDPAFISTSNFALTANSDAVNRGNDADFPNDVAIDILGNPRRVSTLDIGAFESMFAPATTAATAVHVAGTSGKIVLALLLIAAMWKNTRRKR